MLATIIQQKGQVLKRSILLSKDISPALHLHSFRYCPVSITVEDNIHLLHDLFWLLGTSVQKIGCTGYLGHPFRKWGFLITKLSVVLECKSQ
jgi:hypothetical protein